MIEIDNRQDKIKISEDINTIIDSAIDFALKYEDFDKPYEVSVVITDNNGIRNINREFRKINRDTDVLSFPMIEYKEVHHGGNNVERNNFEDTNPQTGEVILGDIVISIEKAFAQADEYGHSIMREVAFLTVHSVLHLLGYDHELNDDMIIMRKKEEDILNIMKLFR